MLPRARANNDLALGISGQTRSSADTPVPIPTVNPVIRRLPNWVTQAPSRVLNVPVRVGRSITGMTSRRSAPTSELAATAPNALDKPRFNPSQHPSSGPVPITDKAKNALASLTVEQMQVPAKGSVVNKDNEVDARQMRAFAFSLETELKQARAIIHKANSVGDPELSYPLQKKLHAEIDSIIECLEHCKHMQLAKPDNAHQMVRDHYADIAKRSRALVKQFPISARPTVKSRNNKTIDEDGADVGVPHGSNAKQLAHFFDDLAQLSTEVKRHHYERAMKIRLDQYAENVFNNWLLMAPAFALQRKGSEMSFAKEYGVGISAGVDLGNVGIIDELLVGGKLNYSYTLLNRLFIDKDGSTAGTNTSTHAIKAGLGVRIGRLLRLNNEKSPLASCYASAKVAKTTGEYHDFKNWKDYIKAEVVRDASKKWSLLNPLPKVNASSGGKPCYRQTAKSFGEYIAGDLLGIMHRNENLPPSVNQKKRDKGAYNSSKIRLLGGKLSQRLPREEGAAPARIGELVNELYPTAKVALEWEGAKDFNHNLTLEKISFSSPSDVVTLPGPANEHPVGAQKSLQKWEMEFKLEAGVHMVNLSDATGRRLRLSAEAHALYNALRTSIGFIRLKAPHEHLDPGYNKNIKTSENLLKELQELKIGEGANERDSPTAFFHNKIFNHATQKSRELIEATARLNAADPSDPDRVNTSRADQLENLSEAPKGLFYKVKEIRGKYIELMDLASEHRAFSGQESYLKKSHADGKAYSLDSYQNTTFAAENKAEFEKFQNKLDVFIKNVFGLPEVDADGGNLDFTKEQKDFYEKLVKDPEFFMTKSYNTFSTALGAVGIEMYKHKENVHQFIQANSDNPANPETAVLMDDLRAVDIVYRSLADGINSVALPINKEKLLRGGPLHATCDSNNRIYKVEAEGGVGIDMSLIKMIPENDDPTALARNPEASSGAQSAPGEDNGTFRGVSGWVPPSLMGLGAKLSFSRLNADKHPNPCREGSYNQLRVSVKADGLTGALIKHATKTMVAGLDRTKHHRVDPTVKAKLGLDPKDTANTELMGSREKTGDHNGFIEETIVAAKRSLFSQYTGEYEFSKDSMAPHPVGEHVYQRTEQFIRFTSRNTVKNGLTIGAPVNLAGSPVTPTIGVHVTHADGNVLFETMGINPSYQMLSFNEMLQVLQKAPKAGVIIEPHKKDINASKVLEECDFDKIEKMFLGKHIEGKDDLDSQFKLNKFFGTNETIIGFLDHFLEYQDKRREIGAPKPAEFGGERTEFDRMDDKPEYWDIIKGLANAEKFKPGTDVYNKDTGGKLIEQFKAPINDDPRPTISDEIKSVQRGGVEAMESEQTVFEDAKKDLAKINTPEERLKYFMTTEKGREVFAMYCRVLNEYTKINEALKASTKYECKVVEK